MGISKAAVKTLIDCFVNEEVIIFLKQMNVVAVSSEGDQMEVTAMIQGFLVHVDQDFLYLGLPDGEVTRSIGHDTAQMIELHFAHDEMTEPPGEDDGVH